MKSLKYKSKYKKVGVLLTKKVKSNVSSVGPSSERNDEPASSQTTSTTLNDYDLK